MDATGRTGGHQPAGRRTAGQAGPGRTPDGRTPDAGHPTGGHRTAGHRAGRGTSLGGHPMVDNDRRWTTADSSAYPTTATPTTGTPPRSRVGAAWGGQQPGQLRRRRPRQGLATAATRQLRGDTPMSSRRLGALLSSDDYGSSVMRAAERHPLWHVQSGDCCWRSAGGPRGRVSAGRISWVAGISRAAGRSSRGATRPAGTPSDSCCPRSRRWPGRAPWPGVAVRGGQGSGGPATRR